MIPTIPSYNGYVVGPNGEELRTPLQQIQKNKQDIEQLKEEGSVQIQQQISALNEKVDTNFNAATSLISQKVEKPNKSELPTGSDYKVLTINGNYNTDVLDYAEDPDANSLVLRTNEGGILANTAYGEKEMVVTLPALENAQTFNFIDFFSTSSPSYIYKPYWFAAKGWGPTQGYAEGRITSVPTDANTEWFQKIANANNSQKTVIIENGLQFNQSYSTIAKCVSQFTDQIAGLNHTEGTIPGRNDLWITVKPHSTINIRCRNRPTGYTQIWIC